MCITKVQNTNNYDHFKMCICTQQLYWICFKFTANNINIDNNKNNIQRYNYKVELK